MLGQQVWILLIELYWKVVMTINRAISVQISRATFKSSRGLSRVGRYSYIIGWFKTRWHLYHGTLFRVPIEEITFCQCVVPIAMTVVQLRPALATGKEVDYSHHHTWTISWTRRAPTEVKFAIIDWIGATAARTLTLLSSVATSRA